MAALSLLAIAQGAPGAGLALVEAGRPVASIVIPAKPTEGESRAARALRDYILKISGASLPVVKGRGLHRRAVLVGRAARKAARRAKKLKRNGFVLEVGKRAVEVAGRDDLGTLFGAYRLLELLGCRFYAPGELGEVVPRARDVVVPRVSLVKEPDFEVRGIVPCPSDWAVKNGLNVGVGGLDGAVGEAPGPCLERWRLCRSHPAGDPECPSNRAFPEGAAEWRKHRGRLLVCDRLLEPNWHGLPWPVVRRLALDFAAYRKAGASGVLLSAGDDWLGLGAATYWAAARLLWKADADLDALLDDFFSNFYGPAAGPMRACFEELERAFEGAGCLRGDAWGEALRVFRPEVLEFCERCIEEAERTARGIFAERVALARAGLDYVCLYVNLLERRRELVGPWVPFVGRQAAFHRLRELVDELRSLLKAHLGDHSLWSGALPGPLEFEIPRKVEALRPFSLPICGLGEERVEAEGGAFLVHRAAINSGLLPYVLEYRAPVGGLRTWVAFGHPAGREPSGLALVGPTRSNFGQPGALDVAVSGVRVGQFWPEFHEHTRSRFIRLVWRTDVATVRLALKEPEDLSALLVSGRVWPRGSLGPVVVLLRAQPCGPGPSDGRRVATAMRSVGTASGGEVPVIALDTRRENWALLYDEALEVAGRSEGPCAFAFPPGEPASVSVEVGQEAVEARLTYPVGTRKFGLIVWEFPGLSHEEALSRLKSELERALDELGKLP